MRRTIAQPGKIVLPGSAEHGNSPFLMDLGTLAGHTGFPLSQFPYEGNLFLNNYSRYTKAVSGKAGSKRS